MRNYISDISSGEKHSTSCLYLYSSSKGVVPAFFSAVFSSVQSHVNVIAVHSAIEKAASNHEFDTEN